MRKAPGLFFTAVVLLTLTACFNQGSASAAPGQNLGPAPAWTLKNLEGKSVSLSDFKGKVVVLNLWATWCEPCRAELPHFIDVQKEWKGKDVTVVGMSIDSTGPADVAAFVKDKGINYPIVMADLDAATVYGADMGIPLTIVIDKKGNVIDRHLGIADRDLLESDIKKALAN